MGVLKLKCFNTFNTAQTVHCVPLILILFTLSISGRVCESGYDYTVLWFLYHEHVFPKVMSNVH